MNMNNTNIYVSRHEKTGINDKIYYIFMKESIQNIISTYKVRTETKQQSLILSYLILLQTPYLAFMVAKLKSIF